MFTWAEAVGVSVDRRFYSTSFSGVHCRRGRRSTSRLQTGSAVSFGLCALQRVCFQCHLHNFFFRLVKL